MTERMQQEAQENNGLIEEALDLVIRLHEDPANPVTRDLIRDWQMRSGAHAQAWAQAAEIYGMTGKVLSEQHKPGQAGTALSRRGLLTLGLMGLAAGGGFLYGPRMLAYAKADYVTSTAELRHIRLADGTRVTLGPDGAIRADVAASPRRAELLAGMAFIEVADEGARLFQAMTGSLTVTAQGAAFDLSNDAGYLSVSVGQGVVNVTTPRSPPGGGEHLSRGDYLLFDEHAMTQERGERDPDQTAFWREGMIVAERETVAAVIAKIERWQKARIFIADRAFGTRRISGVFDLGDPAAALEAVVYPHGGTVRHLSPWLIVVSPV